MNRFTVLMLELHVSLLRSGFKRFALALLLQWVATSVAATDCVPLQRVNIERSEVLDPSQQVQLLSSFIGRCIDVDLTQQILSQLSQHFIDKGYVTTRPYLQEQDISDGQIEVRILLGRVEAIVDAKTNTGNGKISTAFLFTDELLNLRELETALETIERVGSVRAAFEIKPGTQPGGSVIAIEFSEAQRFRTHFGVNAQTELDPQLSFRASYDNPFNINDIIEFRYNSGEIFQTYQSNRNRELDYSFPLGSYLIRLTYSDITSTQRVQGINDSFLSEGETEGHELQISKILSRDQTSKLTAAIGLKLKDSSSFFDGQPIDVSSYKTSQLRIDLQHIWIQNWGQLNNRISYYQGLDSFGARDDDYFTIGEGSDTEARLQFEKYIVDSQLHYLLTDPSWNLSLQLNLQYSDDILFDNDKLYLGSPNTVRGYASALSGSNGWYLRGNLSKRLRSVITPSSGKAAAKSITLSTGLDYGEIKCEIDNEDVCGEIYGLGVGFEISDANFHGRLHWGHPLKRLGDDIGDEDIFLLDLRWSL